MHTTITNGNRIDPYWGAASLATSYYSDQTEHAQSYHRLPQVFTDAGQNGGVGVVCDSLHHGLGSLVWVGALEDPRANEHPVHAQLHQQGHVSRSGCGVG